MRAAMRRTDTVARLGERRIAVVCEAPDRGIATIVERVSRVTRETLALDGERPAGSTPSSESPSRTE